MSRGFGIGYSARRALGWCIAIRASESRALGGGDSDLWDDDLDWDDDELWDE